MKSIDGTLNGSGWTTGSDNLYIWDTVQIVQKRASDGSTVQRNYFDQGFEEGSNDYYYTKDHLGSIREVLASDGLTIEAVYDYSPWGEVSKVAGTGVESDFLYTGHFFHQSSDLHLALYRAYDPALGMWLSRDPIAENGGINLYAYVGNNPVNYWDPYGLAYFASRPLNALGNFWLGPLSRNPIDNFFNTELSHEHLFFEDDKCPNNAGYGPSGSINNESLDDGYRKRDGGYDDATMRQAVEDVNSSGNWSGDSYCLIGHNCQDWASAVRKRYKEIMDKKEGNDCDY